MLLQDVLNKIYYSLGDLPGEKAHQELSPYPRSSAKVARRKSKEPMSSAVLILLYAIDFKPYFTLIQRQEYDGAHSGQIALPGGKREEDETLKETALRETEEEIGVSSEKIIVLGELTEVYIPPSNFIVTPFIGYMDERPEFIPEIKEVASVLEVPLEQLMDDSLLKEKKIQVTKYSPTPYYLEVPYFELNFETVWGATALILNELKTILK